MPDFWALKNFQNASNDKTQKVGCTLFSELRICELINHKSSFEYPKNPCLNQATQKNTYQIVLKNPGIENFKPNPTIPVT